jgi:leucyl aminopeptidase (aminopeptidase T)
MKNIKELLYKWSNSGKEHWQQTTEQINALDISDVIHFSDYLKALQALITKSYDYRLFLDNDFQTKEFTMEELQAIQDTFYADLSLMPDASGNIPYNANYGNPEHAVKTIGSEMGPLLSMIYTEFRSYRTLIIQKRYTELTRMNNLFLKLYNDVLQNIYSFCHWLEVFKLYSTADMDMAQLFGLYWRLSPEQTYYKDIIEKADLSDLRYLYRYGTYISEQDIKMAQFMSKYPESELKSLSQYIVQSYKDGFERGHRSYQIKKYAVLIIPAGMERLGRYIIEDLRVIGLTALPTQPQTQSFNKQLEYDHRFDDALYYDQAYVDIMIPGYEKAIGMMSDIIKHQAGPVYIELFGETPFNPENKDVTLKLSDEQMQLRRITSGMTTQIYYKHYNREETSFCIIAFPSPEIGANFEAIFADTVKINLLDSIRYGKIQQNIIDVLDKADYVHIKGKDTNATNIKVKLHPLADPDKETNFENCVADVNIPVGEVFTSPLLTGTNGTLHVEDIYLRNLRYYNLKVHFTDGMISDYSCTNFDTVEENRKYIEENLLMPHMTLPIGEFAIGTNTTAYQFAKKYDIMALLPILIIEKMGPHFAIGDTCYTREEDVDHFNFVNGKKLIAVDNEKTALRHTDPMKAYTQVHTDIPCLMICWNQFQQY